MTGQTRSHRLIFGHRGSEDNTVWDLVIGYNGLGRIGGGAGATWFPSRLELKTKIMRYTLKSTRP
ncbi:hypothetical protein AB0F17_38670 [Nonomuraea sp. NPDC026600]|uniref:hypothetical protein n=1 Tax=Nonomuraea sp. NPDC026600 TaxID=3155363 RepID=UPI0033C486BD